ncbi:uncharacterized protein LOC132696790 [Cylas formicarius]|uniref:uncharacterized protein LOC132696790 n=1 Tax=Cylas formicarius TaxID=197179 RepID=UPI0029587A15|nr:uncharacterized protein LOC132696790 [Cylas formicarius]
MAAVVRIKRHLDEDPLNALILNCKRRKLSCGENEEEKSAVLQFAGTSEEENIENLLNKYNVAKAADIKEHFKKPPIDILQKLRTEVKEQSRNNRYKIVNRFRQIIKINEECENLKSDPEFTVFDIETDFNRNDSTERNKNDSVIPKYVYDFYYTSSDDLGDADLDELSVYPLMDSQYDPFIFGSMRDNGLEGKDSDGDSDDSNAECNWRNDYPDEDDLESINEDDMIGAVNNINLGEDLSSDDGEEDFVYSRYDDNGGYNLRADKLKYGKLYADFKAKNLNDSYYSDIDEDEYFH